MKVHVSLSSLKETRPHELAVRFVLGGAITALTGLIAGEWGPVIGGLFLAFPAIFPASVTLVEKHTVRKKEKYGLRGDRLGRYAAGADAAGAVIGSVGLVTFSFIFYKFAPVQNPWMVLFLATIAWFSVSALVWWAWKKL